MLFMGGSQKTVEIIEVIQENLALVLRAST